MDVTVPSSTESPPAPSPLIAEFLSTIILESPYVPPPGEDGIHPAYRTRVKAMGEHTLVHVAIFLTIAQVRNPNMQYAVQPNLLCETQTVSFAPFTRMCSRHDILPTSSHSRSRSAPACPGMPVSRRRVINRDHISYPFVSPHETDSTTTNALNIFQLTPIPELETPNKSPYEVSDHIPVSPGANDILPTLSLNGSESMHSTSRILKHSFELAEKQIGTLRSPSMSSATSIRRRSDLVRRSAQTLRGYDNRNIHDRGVVQFNLDHTKSTQASHRGFLRVLLDRTNSYFLEKSVTPPPRPAPIRPEPPFSHSSLSLPDPPRPLGPYPHLPAESAAEASYLSQRSNCFFQENSSTCHTLSPNLAPPKTVPPRSNSRSLSLGTPASRPSSHISAYPRPLSPYTQLPIDSVTEAHLTLDSNRFIQEERKVPYSHATRPGPSRPEPVFSRSSLQLSALPPSYSNDFAGSLVEAAEESNTGYIRSLIPKPLLETTEKLRPNLVTGSDYTTKADGTKDINLTCPDDISNHIGSPSLRPNEKEYTGNANKIAQILGKPEFGIVAEYQGGRRGMINGSISREKNLTSQRTGQMRRVGVFIEVHRAFSNLWFGKAQRC